MSNIQSRTAEPAADESLEALVGLHTISVDTLHGFQKMSEKAEPEFRPVVDRFCAVHIRHAARLDTMVREMGGIPDASGSFMGTVNRAVVGLRSIFDTIDAGVMKNVREGEDRVVAAFNNALRSSLPQGHQQALTQMQAELAAVLADTRHLS